MNIEEVKKWRLRGDAYKEPARVDDRIRWLISEHDRLTAEVATAYSRGMSKAAEIAEGRLMEMGYTLRVASHIAAIIRAAIPSADRETERCEWTRPRDWNGMHDTSCGHLLDYEESFQFCPHCGKPISLKEP